MKRKLLKKEKEEESIAEKMIYPISDEMANMR